MLFLISKLVHRLKLFILILFKRRLTPLHHIAMRGNQALMQLLVGEKAGEEQTASEAPHAARGLLHEQQLLLNQQLNLNEQQLPLREKLNLDARDLQVQLMLKIHIWNSYYGCLQWQLTRMIL